MRKRRRTHVKRGEALVVGRGRVAEGEGDVGVAFAEVADQGDGAGEFRRERDEFDS
jgi:hypothetical protein